MTQEELDALMADVEDEQTLSNESDEIVQESQNEPDIESDSLSDLVNDEPLEEEKSEDCTTENLEDDEVELTASTPPPADEEHRVVEQLDDVTRESEEKANEVFDKLDETSLVANNISNATTEQLSLIESNIELFERLTQKFENVESFKVALKDNRKLLERTKEIESESQKISELMTDTMNVMQYQDIHRQKIERVINVMRALSHYMHSLFDSKVDDADRASSAVTIDSENTIAEDELEALLESFAKK